MRPENCKRSKQADLRVLLDTNCVILFVYAKADPANIGEARLVRGFVQDHRVCLEQILAKATALSTTPHVLTECSNLMRQKRGMSRDVFDAYSQFVLSCEEEFIGAGDLIDDPALEAFGLTDTVLAYFASRGSTVVTTDYALCNAILAAGHTALNLHHQLQLRSGGL